MLTEELFISFPATISMAKLGKNRSWKVSFCTYYFRYNKHSSFVKTVKQKVSLSTAIIY